VLVAASAGCAPRVDEVLGARDRVDALTSRMLEHFAQGDLEAWGRTLTDDVFLIAADPEEAIAGRDAILEELQSDFEPAFAQGLRLDLRSRARRIGLARDLESAWVTDEIDYGVESGGRRATYRLRFSGVAAETESGWRFLVLHFSRPLSLEAAVRLAGVDSLPSPRDPGDSEPNRRTRTVKRLFERTVADTARWLRYVTRRQDASFVAPDTVVTGSRAVRRQLRREFARGLWERDTTAGVRVGRAGRVGWAVTTLQRRTTIGGREVAIPHRALFVYHRRGETWGLVHAHLSSGLEDPE
jgi:ketosteroid isomerase-like protein